MRSLLCNGDRKYTLKEKEKKTMDEHETELKIMALESKLHDLEDELASIKRVLQEATRALSLIEGK